LRANIENLKENNGFMIYRQLRFLLLATVLFLATANATTVAILEITIAYDEIDLAIDETQFLTDELRRQAIRILPKDYSILTREKIISLIPDGDENFNSIIDIGIALKSDYVTRGFIGKVGSLFTLTVELYETASGNLLGDFVKESKDLKDLLDATRENAPYLFAKIMPETIKESQQPTSIPTNIPSEPKKSKTSFWVAIGLDVLGAVALGFGVYNNAKSIDYYDKSKNILKDVPPWQYAERKSEFTANHKKMQNAETAQNIFYATGGALLLGGVVVHIWF